MDALARRSTIRELVAAFEKAEATVRACFGQLVDAERELTAVFSYGSTMQIRIDATGHGYQDSFDNPDRAVERMARQAWSYLVDRLEMRRVMSIARWEQLQRQLERGELPPITEASVAAFVEQYAGSLPTMLEEAVGEVHDWLRPPRSIYKTNTELEVGRRCVLRFIVDKRMPWDTTRRRYRVDYHATQKLIALENVLNALDGKGQISKDHYSDLQRAIEASEGSGKTALFGFRVFDNGNMHLTFLRDDLLARFNQVAGGRRLRPHVDCPTQHDDTNS